MSPYNLETMLIIHLCVHMYTHILIVVADVGCLSISSFHICKEVYLCFYKRKAHFNNSLLGNQLHNFVTFILFVVEQLHCATSKRGLQISSIMPFHLNLSEKTYALG